MKSGALLEEVDQKLGIIIEGQQTIERKVDTLTKTQSHLNARVERTEVLYSARTHDERHSGYAAMGSRRYSCCSPPRTGAATTR
jgi:hypothetical protein